MMMTMFSSCKVCTCGAFSGNEEDPSCSFLDTWYLTYPAGFSEARPRERSDYDRFFTGYLTYPADFNEAVFCLRAKKPFHTGVCKGCHSLISPSVCVCARVCVYHSSF